MKYDPYKIEKKWQKKWEEKDIYRVIEDESKEKYYILDMFPYPSGSGLHVGHLIGYTATDVLARYKKSKGFAVLHPMGWDSFGLPAERYAIRTGTHPAVTTAENIANFKKQLSELGFSYDWNREIATSESSYYKWTQWIFTILHKKDLAYKAEIPVNYCPALGVVLANEEVENGFSREGGYPVEKKYLKQWMLKITKYADRLSRDLEELDWPEGIKQLQKNWIGKSVGLSIEFDVEAKNEKISVFTTRPDTLFGVTYLAVAPEHAFVKNEVLIKATQEVKNEIQHMIAKSDLERTSLAKEYKGIFSGHYAIHPITKKQVPIFIADYVLISYGTGAVMGVPAHDERDFAFAVQNKIASIPVILPEDEDARKALISGEQPWVENGICSEACCFGDFSVVGISNLEAVDKIVEFIEENKLGVKKIFYKLRDWLFSRQRYWGEPIPVLNFEDGTSRLLDLDELPLNAPQITDYEPSEVGVSPLANSKDWVNIIDSKTGMKAERETDTMPQWAGSCWYYLRFCSPTFFDAAFDPEKEKYWMPVDLYVGGAEHAVLHLLYARFWHKVLYDCGFVTTKEPFKKLINQGLVVSRSYKIPGGVYISPEDVIETDGVYTYRKTGEVLESQIEKMSKSKLNGESPEEIIEEFGVDALRLYTVFIGPIEKEKIWNTHNITGCKRFLNRFFDLVQSDKVCEENSDQALRFVNKLIADATEGLENFLLNTVVAKLMEFLNNITTLDKYPKAVLKDAIKVLSPFAPHVAQEMWSILGEDSVLYHEAWPVVDKKYLENNEVTYVVQVNGKVRGKFVFDVSITEEQIIDSVKNESSISKHITGDVVKVIFVRNRLVNFVIRS